MLHPDLRQQLGRDNVAAVAKAAQERCRMMPVTSTSQTRRRQLCEPRIEPRTSAAPDPTTI